MWGSNAVNYLNTVLAAGEEAVPAASGGGLGIGAVALTLIVVLLLVWMGYLYLNSRRSKVAAQEAAPSNLAPHIGDDELENKKLTRVLRAALFGSILLAVIMPWYAFNEPGRQEAFAEATIELDVEEGAHWYSPGVFECGSCHGPDGVGGSTEYAETRSGIMTTWAVPALNDIFYRYDEAEVRYWIVFGRDGTPMPSNGLEGGGAMTVQEIDQVIAYLHSIEISQEEAFVKSEGLADFALVQMAGGAEATQRLINFQQIQIDEVEEAPEKMEVAGPLPDRIKDLLQGPGTCTAASAELVSTTCDQPGVDTDRDGLTDEAERGLTAIAATSYDTLTVIAPVTGDITYELVAQDAYDVRFDPFDAFTNGGADLDAAEELLAHVGTDVLLLSVVADRQDQFFEGLRSGLAFLEDALEQRVWEVDFAAIASEMGVSEDDAKLAVGLFNGSCARCHTGGYAAGPTFSQGPGSGAWGPSLVDGRSLVQFPNVDDQIAFVVGGSQNAEQYGINGIGTGRMPAFGQILSESQIELIVKYERTL